jgi:hypothetical protein
MKDKVIETTGKIWHELGYRGQATSRKLSQILNEDEEIVNLALGWLAREDKVACSEKRDHLIFSLVESEMNIFKGFYGDSFSKNKESFWHRLFR